MARRIPLTFASHKAEWGACRKCDLHRHRKRVCLVRGKFGDNGLWKLSLPAPIVFIGEAPGYSEDSSGDPFDGPSGHLLERIARDAGAFAYECAWTNTVGCIPIVDGSKAKKPPGYALETCKPRLRDILTLCQPKLVVMVGDVAEKWIEKHLEYFAGNVKTVGIVHPSYILQMPQAGKTLEIRRAIITLKKAVDALSKPPAPASALPPGLGLFD